MIFFYVLQVNNENNADISRAAASDPGASAAAVSDNVSFLLITVFCTLELSSLLVLNLLISPS